VSTRGPIIIAAVLALLLASPFVIGMISENAVRDGVEQFAAQSTTHGSIDSYERGWLGSKARMQFGLDPEYLAGFGELAANPMVGMLGNLSLPVIAEFEHGPVLRTPGLGLGTTSIHAYIDPESPIAQTAQALLGIPYLIDFRGRGSFGLGFDYEGDVPPFQIALPDLTLESSGIDFTGSFGGGDKVFEGALEYLSVQAMFVSAILDSISVTSDMKRAQTGEVPMGSVALNIGRFAISDPFQGIGSSFTADGVSVTSSVDESDDDSYIDVGLVYATEALTIGNDIAVSNLQLGLNLEHLDADAVNAIYGLTEPGNFTSNPIELQMQIMPLLSQIFSGAPVLSMDPLSFSMPEGEATGRLSMSLNSDVIPPGGVLDEMALMLAMQSAEIKLDLSASKTLVQSLAEQYLLSQMATVVDSGIQGQPPVSPEQLAAQAEMQTNLVLLVLSVQGMIVDSGDAWTTTLSLENGVPTANGQPIPLGF